MFFLNFSILSQFFVVKSLFGSFRNGPLLLWIAVLCLIFEMLFIRELNPELNTQKDSILTKLFT